MNLRLKFQFALANIKYHGVIPFLRHVVSRLTTINTIQTSVKYQDLMKSAKGIYFGNLDVLKAVGIAGSKQNYLKIKEFLTSLGERKLPINWDSNLETLSVLYGVARHPDFENILEIGTGNGVSASILGLAIKDKKKGIVHTLDILSESGSSIPANLEGVVVRHIVSPSLSAKSKFVKALIPNPDLIYIDGAHDYINARSDFELAISLRPRLIVLDDIEVTKFFLEVCKIQKLEYLILIDGRKVVGIVDLSSLSL